MRATITDLKLKDGAKYKADLSSANTYYPFGMLMPERNWSSEWYRYGFQGQEKDDEIKGEGNSINYTYRMHDPRLGRFFSLDPLASKYPMLTPFQHSSLNPISNIELEGLEGIQYQEITKMKDGTLKIKRIVELDIYVATSKEVSSLHYKSSDLSTIKTNLLNEFNKGFKDKDGNIVEFKFNITEFDADVTKPLDKSLNLRKDPKNMIVAKDGFTTAFKGFVLQRGELNTNEQGKTLIRNSLSTISNSAIDPSHTQAHETAHIFLNYDPSLNPVSIIDHKNAGGIFEYKVNDKKGNTLIPTKDLNQGNVDVILKTVPEIESKTVKEK